MELFALKCGDQFMRDLKEDGWALVPLEKASVYPSIEKARGLKEKVETDAVLPLVLVVLTLTAREISWT